MADTTVSYPLFNSDFIDLRTGKVTRPWQQWLTALWSRAGGANAPGLDVLAALAAGPLLTSTALPDLPNGRLPTNTASITWDFSTANVAFANVLPEFIEDAVGDMLLTTTTVLLTYNDGTGELSADVRNDSITYAIMQNISAASRLLGRGSAAGAGDTQELTVGSGLSISGTVLDTVKTFTDTTFIEAPTNKTYVLVSSARFGFTIGGLFNLKTVSGTLTLAIQINGTNVTGLSGLAVTSTPQSPSASGANTVVVGDRVTAVVTSVSSPVDLEFTVG